MSPFVAEADAKLFEWGSRNRGPRNWENGCRFSRCVQSMYRHLVKFMMRETDEEHDDNLGAIRFWAGALIHYKEMIKRGLLPETLDDMPRYDLGEQDVKLTANQIKGFNTLVESIRSLRDDDPDDTPHHQAPPQDFTATCPIKDEVDEFDDECSPDQAIDAAEYAHPEDVVAAEVARAEYSPQLKIYIAGPISEKDPAIRKANYDIGRASGDFIRGKGHLVFTPHNYDICTSVEQYEDLLDLDFSIIRDWADAVYFIHPSPGASREVKLAQHLGKHVFYSMHEVPNAID